MSNSPKLNPYSSLNNNSIQNTLNNSINSWNSSEQNATIPSAHASLNTLHYASLTAPGYGSIPTSLSNQLQPSKNQIPATQTKSSSSLHVGSDDWAKQRRENHKEVERKRRETINEGIAELSRLVPDGEKNKGRVILRAVQYINELKAHEAANLEKWTLEKLMCEQAIQELQVQNETYARELKFYYEENKRIKPETHQLREEVVKLRLEIAQIKQGESKNDENERFLKRRSKLK
ncbi:basic helix-loop-helix protein, partial [Nowakowskiella sp. JEL0078]